MSITKTEEFEVGEVGSTLALAEVVRRKANSRRKGGEVHAFTGLYVGLAGGVGMRCVLLIAGYQLASCFLRCR